MSPVNTLPLGTSMGICPDTNSISPGLVTWIAWEYGATGLGALRDVIMLWTGGRRAIFPTSEVRPPLLTAAGALRQEDPRSEKTAVEPEHAGGRWNPSTRGYGAAVLTRYP